MSEDLVNALLARHATTGNAKWKEAATALTAQQAEIERLKAMVDDMARWEPIAASYRDERDALADLIRESAPVTWAANSWENGGVEAAQAWEKKATAALKGEQDDG